MAQNCTILDRHEFRGTISSGSVLQKFLLAPRACDTLRPDLTDNVAGPHFSGHRVNASTDESSMMKSPRCFRKDNPVGYAQLHEVFLTCANTVTAR